MSKTFTIIIVSESGAENYIQIRDKRPKRPAILRAKALAAENADKQVFLEFIRSHDGQRGYINRDGSSSMTGSAF